MGLGIVAHIAFWVLVLLDARELELRRPAVFLVLWVAGYVASGRMMMAGAYLFQSYVAILDIVLVLVLFKGDVAIR